MNRPSRREVSLQIAEKLSERTTCARRGVGCVLTDFQGHILSTGYNGVPEGWEHCTDKPCQGATCDSTIGLDLCLAIHAEQNALLQCPDVRKIDTCYVTVSPCIHCMKLLLNTSCQHIIFREIYSMDPLALWEKAGRVWVEL